MSAVFPVITKPRLRSKLHHLNKFVAVTVVGIAMAIPLAADQANPGKELAGAIKQLVTKENYSWITAVKNGLGPVQGQVSKDGRMYVVTSLPGVRGTREAVIGAGKFAEKFPNGWRVTPNLGTQREIGGLLRNRCDPAVQAADLVSKVAELKSREQGVYFGELTDEAARELSGLLGWEVGPSAAARGTATFWVKEGTLVRFEYHVVLVSGGREVTRTTEIKDIGTTKVEIPDEAEEVLKK